MTRQFITFAPVVLMLFAIGSGLFAFGKLPTANSRQPIDPVVQFNADSRALTAESTGYGIFWYRIAAGGETFSIGDVYELGGTIGQHEAGLMSGNDYALAGGFWAGATQLCKLADINCDGVVDGADLLALLADWGDCPDCDDCPTDLNGDCVVDGADLLILLSNWG